MVWRLCSLPSIQGLPAYLKNHIIYYAGPAKTPAGYASGSFGPTTAGTLRRLSIELALLIAY